MTTYGDDLYCKTINGAPVADLATTTSLTVTGLVKCATLEVDTSAKVKPLAKPTVATGAGSVEVDQIFTTDDTLPTITGQTFGYLAARLT